jgi:tetratricopeptide (TPR) repeat protein
MRAPAHFFLANCDYVENDLEKALPEYEAAIREGNVPSNKALNAYYYNYGLALYRLRRYDQAAAAFRQSLALFPTDPLPRFFLSRALAETGSYGQAIELLKQIVSEHADFAPALYQLARLEAAHGDRELARGLFQRYAALRRPGQAEDGAVKPSLKLGP